MVLLRCSQRVTEQSTVDGERRAPRSSALDLSNAGATQVRSRVGHPAEQHERELALREAASPASL